jgi:hypothetical protein
MKNNAISNGFYNYLITLSPEMVIIEESTENFFDFLENVWGFAVICFSVVLMKATKYINRGQKSRRVASEKAEFRDNICVLASKVHQIQNGRTSAETSKAQFCLKRPLPL